MDSPGKNSKIGYKLKLKSADFQIDAQTGQFVLIRPLTFDPQNFGGNFRQISIVAFDHGQPSLSSTCLVVVRILEANFHKPRFENFKNRLAIPENVGKDDILTKITAIDQFDTGINSLVGYKFEEHSEYFSIDPDSGEKKFVGLQSFNLVCSIFTGFKRNLQSF